MPDAGNIKWSSRATVGYLDQHTVLTKGNTIRDILRDAFKPMFDLEKEMNAFLKAISEEQLLDIKYNVAAIGEDDDEQIYCFSAMIVYRT